MFEIVETNLAGALILKPKVHKDSRGKFVKIFHAGFFAEHGLETNFVEDFYSVSVKGVLRGMHYQAPPHDHAKLVTCLGGRVQDAVVDIRKSSPTFSQHFTIELSDENGWLIYIPSGFAHGFLALSDNAVVCYKTTTVHNPGSDCGILWDSSGINWKTNSAPVISDRDGHHTTLRRYAKNPIFN